MADAEASSSADPTADGEDICEKASVSSLTTKSSRLSRVSFASRASKASAAAAAVLRKSLSFGGSSSSERRNTTMQVANMVNLIPGDMCETIAIVTVRREETLESEVLAELQVGTTLHVVDIGEGRRIKVAFNADSSTKLEGWISSKTKINEPLVMKCNPDVHLATMDFEVGGQHEVKATVTVREGEDLDSGFITELMPGVRVRILELGVHNKRRVKVSSSHSSGWISTATKFGEPLIGKVQDNGNPTSFNITNNGAKVKALLEAARSGNLEELQKVAEGTSGVMGRLTSKPSLNSSDVRGKTALIYASAFGNKEVVRYLLSKREVDVNAMDDTQKCALHHASKRAQKPGASETDNIQGDIVNMLLDAGAYLEARDHNGCTALMFAVANGDIGVTRVLLKSQANVNVKDFEGHRPLDYAINFDHEDIAQLLIEAGGVSYDWVPPHARTSVSTSVSASTGAPSLGDVSLPESSSAAPPSEAPDEAASIQGSPEASPSASPTTSASATPKKRVTKKRVSLEPKAADPEAVATGSSTPVKPKAKAKRRVSSKEGDGGSTATGGAKKPKAKAKKKALATTMMLEALGADDGGKDVRVEEMPTEDVDLKVRALQRLNAVVESDGSPGELEAAIKVAVAEGVSEEKLTDAKEKLQGLKLRYSVRDALRNATKEREVGGLKLAIAEAEKIGLTDSELAAAKKVLAEEEPRQRAREALEAAKESGDTQQLKNALSAGEVAKLKEEELSEYRELLAGAESKEKAQAALEAAMDSRDVPHLKFTIQQAREVGVDAAAIAEAEKILKVEEPKHLARHRLSEALDVSTKEALQAAVAAAEAAGLEESEPLLRQARSALKKELEKERWLASVNQVLQETMSCNMADIDSVRRAKNALNQAIVEATKIGVAEKDLAPAEIRRKKLHNTIEDLKGSIRVFARIRPLSSKEKDAGDANVCKQTDLMGLQVGDKPEHQFRFDAVFTPGTQDEIFEDCRDLVQSAVDGYNVTLFAYGQTGAGKTFTMAGVPGQLGISPRTINELYSVLQQNQDRFEYTVMASMLELYRTDLVDLLVKGNNVAATKGKLKIRDDKTGAVAVEHLTEEECVSALDLENLVARGTQARAVASTMMNSESSRSHLILMVKIVGVNRETQEQTRGKILIVDLAGSERLSKSQTTGDAQKESIEINKSLTALGDVIEGLTQKWKVIPYRNHKLTMLMQDALGGTAKTLMFVNCSPASSNFEETVNSLKYAQRAKNITNTIAKAK
mmetsp:Transcript_94100/g.206089  ORF Transcript_94100/g.206089 Transcript_94100/m.206089 type:complete len:1250 (+) Transcript_94100:224-3973(+)